MSSHVRVSDQCSEEFGMRVGMHQGSVLSPLLIILVLEVPSLEFHTGVPWELPHTDDLVLTADTQKECISKIKAWKAVMDSKRLHVSIKRPCCWSLVLATMSLRNLAGIPLLCVVVVLATTPSSAHSACFVSTRGVVASLNDWSQTKSMSAAGVMERFSPAMAELDGTVLDVEASFCYLGDILVVLRWGLWQCHCCQMCGLGKVQETLACLNHQTPVSWDTQLRNCKDYVYGKC